MLRIGICCLGGFSSSALVNHLQEDLKKLGLEDQVSFVFIPYSKLLERESEVDIGMVCPHSETYAKANAAKHSIPVTVIPTRLYGLMSAQAFIEDAEDLLELWKKGMPNLVHFEEEPRPLVVKRLVSHRRWLKGEKAFPKD